MRRAFVEVNGCRAGSLEEHSRNHYVFRYFNDYTGPLVSLSMPLSKHEYIFERFPPFFEGLLPEGEMLEGLLGQCKIDRFDLFSQLIAIGAETVGAVTVMEAAT